MKNLLFIVYSILAIFLFTNTSFATRISIIPDDLAIDLRDVAWEYAEDNTLSSYTVGNVTASTNNNSYLTRNGVDGLGIFDNNGSADEINGNESLIITFDTEVYLTGVWLTNLFYPDNNYKTAAERGYVILDGLAFYFEGNQDFYHQDTNSNYDLNGDFYVDFGGPIFVTSAIFMNWELFTGADPLSNDNDFAVAGFTVSPVPEPATMLLLGLGLIGIAGISRKKS